MTETFQLVDLTGDGHGHHIPGTPIVFRHGWLPVTDSPGGGKQKTKTLHTPKTALVTRKGKVRENRPSVFRNFHQAADDERAKLYKEAGLKMEFPDDNDEELYARWKNPGTSPEARVKIHHELEKRAKRLQVLAEAIDQELTDTRRDDRRERIARLTDPVLMKMPGGKHIVALKDKILADRVLDKVEGFSEFSKTKGKDIAVHAAVTVAITAILGPIAGAASAAFGEHAVEAVEHALHSTLGESSLWLTLGPKFEKAFGFGLEKITKKAIARRLVESRLSEAV